MRLRTPARDRSPSAASGSESTADASPTGGLVRHLLTAVGIIALAYAVARLGSRESIPAVDEVRGRAAETVPDEVRSRAVDAVPEDRIETIRKRTGQTVPDDITEISIEGPGSEESESEPDLESSTETIEGGDESDVTGLDERDGDELDGSGTDQGGDAIDETETNADFSDDRSDEEIAERAESDVQDEPAEPGEMTVDEDVAEDLTTDDSEAESGGEGDDESAE